MNTSVVTTKATCLPTLIAARPFASTAAASGIYAVWSAGYTGVAKHSLKRSAMNPNFDGRPLGSRDGTSG